MGVWVNITHGHPEFGFRDRDRYPKGQDKLGVLQIWLGAQHRARAFRHRPDAMNSASETHQEKTAITSIAKHQENNAMKSIATVYRLDSLYIV